MKSPLVCTNKKTGAIIFNSVEKPSDFFKRNNGLMFRSPLDENEAFLITSTGFQWIHTFFMKFSIDIIYLSKKYEIIKIQKNVLPFRLAAPVFGAWAVLECTAKNKNVQNLNQGDLLYVGT